MIITRHLPFKMYNVSFIALKWRLQSSVYLLTQVVAAHADMESRKTTGSIILKPELLFN